MDNPRRRRKCPIVGPGRGQNQHYHTRDQAMTETMSITKHLKGTQEMKNLQIELKTEQTKKKERQVELEPLQEQEA